jgi:predicted cobalt transporter CbtA
MSAELPARQLWWIVTVTITVVALVLLPLPHLVGAPRAEVLGGAVPPELAAHFVAASLVTAAIFWATLGAFAAWLNTRLERS